MHRIDLSNHQINLSLAPGRRPGVTRQILYHEDRFDFLLVPSNHLGHELSANTIVNTDFAPKKLAGQRCRANLDEETGLGRSTQYPHGGCITTSNSLIG